MKIFCFPYLVIDELMEHLTPSSLFNLALCSKKGLTFVKTFSKANQDIKMQLASSVCGFFLFHADKFSIHMESKPKIYLDGFDVQTIHGFTYCFYKFGYMYTFWQDVVHGVRECTNYICELFKVPVATVYIYQEDNLWLLDFVQQRQEQTLNKVFALKADISAEGYSRIMSCNVTELLDCDMIPPDNFRFDAKLPPVRTLYINHGFWITREHLLGLESHNAQLSHTLLTSSDINALLRVWLNGGLANLKYINLNGMGIVDESYDGISERLEQAQGTIDYKWGDVAGVARFDRNAFHIRRDDGVVATVKNDTGSFMMVVWPDLNGNRV